MNTTFIYHQKGKDPMYKLWHELGDRVMFLYANNANGNIVTREKIYPLKKGSLYFIGAKKSHYTAPESPNEYVRDKLFFTVPRFQEIRTICDKSKHFEEIFANDKLIYAQIPTHEQENIDAIFTELNKHQENEFSSEAILVSACAKLIIYLDEYKTGTFPMSTSANFVFQAIEYINKHISEPLTINDISSAVFMSKYYFCRKFKKSTGLSVMDYILATRLSLAQEMLLDQKLTVSQISNQCGFSSLAYFCNVFKHKHKKTPLQYRKSNKPI